MLRKTMFLGLLLLIFLVAVPLIGQVYADPGAQVNITSIALSADRQAILVTVSVNPKPNNQLTGQVLITLETQLLAQGGFVAIDHQQVIVDGTGGVVQVFYVPFQGVGHYKFIAQAYAYPSQQLLGTAVSDPPAVGGN